MAKHLSLRLAWHDDGWNGCICKNPQKNTYCIGRNSYPGTIIADGRDLQYECRHCGYSCNQLEKNIACSNSINAFGLESITNIVKPPNFFNHETKDAVFELPPSTACTWPYAEMYRDDDGQYDYDKKLLRAKDFFGSLTPNKSLVFYYANKSNPFSEDESKVYPLVGISRLKNTGKIMFYENTSEEVKKKYGGGFVWQMPITSTYPDEGFVIPYHKYMDNTEVLKNILYIPEHTNNFKYAARHISDDDALIYVERLIDIVDYLIKINDNTENWLNRKEWLQCLLAELWTDRGIYPGMGALLKYLGCPNLIQYYEESIKAKDSINAAKKIFDFFTTKNYDLLKNSGIPQRALENDCRSWYIKLYNDKLQELAKTLARIDLTADQIGNILKDNRTENGIFSSIQEIIDNPYILSEEYIGNEIGDDITFAKVDHAVLPEPNLGIAELFSKSDWRRLRALLVDSLKYETIHSFSNLSTRLEEINERLSHYPDWKKEVFGIGHINFDKDKLEKALVFKSKDDIDYLYLRSVFEDERLIEENIKELISRPDIKLRKPFLENRWKDELFSSGSQLALKTPEEYENAIMGQVKTCSKIFTKPCAVIAGSAGTGKTTLIKALIKAIEFTSDEQPICLLAPTGKASNRLRSKTGRPSTTIHSFLTSKGWLNANNWTIKKFGGKKSCDYTTYIIDESSMIDLHLFAALFRAIDWDSVGRIIFVGDPNQLPPIGRGKVFSDIINYMKREYPENFSELNINVRQMENKVLSKGTGILDLAEMYLQENPSNKDKKTKAEQLLKKIQESDENISEDLRVITWNNADELSNKLLSVLERDLEEDNAQNNMMQHQIISPYRGDFFGIENINSIVQKSRNNYNVSHKGTVEGITLFDKVIQCVNRANRNAYKCYNSEQKREDRIDVFNGELGIVYPHSKDIKSYKNSFFKLKNRFAVRFEDRNQLYIYFENKAEIENNLELGYAISVHKAQGSEFDRVYLIIPKTKQQLSSTELLYTGITRAKKHLTILVEGDFQTLISMQRPEKSRLKLINSSVFEFQPLAEKLLTLGSWYEEGKIHSTLTDYFVRSKSEVIIANMLFANGIESIKYEEPLFAPDGTFYLPDFTIQWRGRTYYWEHLGMLEQSSYKAHWEMKQKWYDKFFPCQLITTIENTDLTLQTKNHIDKIKRGEI